MTRHTAADPPVVNARASRFASGHIDEDNLGVIDRRDAQAHTKVVISMWNGVRRGAHARQDC
jgi:hypothetical protein